MRIVSWIAGALVVVAAVLLAGRTFLRPALGPIETTPADAAASVRVGDSLTFTATADNATGWVWSLWDREVSRDPSWTFAPGPEEVGWQQVTVVVTGPGGARRERAWNVGVVAPIAPEMTDTSPAPGRIEATQGSEVTFRARARVPAARDVDRLHFEWTLDDAPIFRDEQPATGGGSQVTVVPNPGTHRIAVHVREVDQIASFTEWTLEVAPTSGSPPTVVARAAPPPTPTIVARAEPEAPPAAAPPPTPTIIARAEPEAPPAAAPPPTPTIIARAEPEAPPAAAPPPTIVARAEPEAPAAVPEPPPLPPAPPVAPGPAALPAAPPVPPPDQWSPSVPRPVIGKTAPPTQRLVHEPARSEVTTLTGTAVAFAARIEPAGDATVYRWLVDGRVVQEGEAGRFHYLPMEPGRHRVTVTAQAADLDVGSAAWVISARAAPPPPPAVAAVPPARTPAPIAMAPRPAIVETARSTPPVPATPVPAGLREDEVRRWLQDYAAAWSRKDVDALRRMGQVRSATEVDRLTRYFRSIDDLRVEVRVVALKVDGDRAAVEFERTDTVTDPAGQRRELRLPTIRKAIERTGQGLRFADGGGTGG